MKTFHIPSLDHLLPPMALDNMAVHIYITVKEEGRPGMTKAPTRVELLHRYQVQANPRFLCQQRKSLAKLRVTVAPDMTQTAAKTRGIKEAAIVAAVKAGAGVGNLGEKH